MGKAYKPNGQNTRKKSGVPESNEVRGGHGCLGLDGSMAPEVWPGFGQVEVGMRTSLWK